MSAEFYKTKKLSESLHAWEAIDISKRKSLINELGEMAIESEQSEGEYAGACNAAANVLFAVNNYPEIIDLVKEKHKVSHE